MQAFDIADFVAAEDFLASTSAVQFDDLPSQFDIDDNSIDCSNVAVDDGSRDEARAITAALQLFFLAELSPYAAPRRPASSPSRMQRN